LSYADYDESGIVVSAIGAQCGRSWLALGQWSCIKNTLRIIQRNSVIPLEYLYWLLQLQDPWPKRGSAQPFIAQTDARAVCLALPSTDRMRLATEALEPIDGLVRVLQDENALLSEIRDTLLPRPLSGEMRVRDAEAMVKDVP
jgi:type I restriction enzyme S subunit